MLDSLKILLSNSGIDEVVSVGYIDTDDTPRQFSAAREILYFEVGEKYLRFESVEQYSRLKIAITDEILYQLPFEMEESFTFCSEPIGDLVLGTTTMGDNAISHVSFFGLEEPEDELLCSACKFTLANGQVLFLDPTYLFGIKIGGATQEEVWAENLPLPKPLETRILL